MNEQTTKLIHDLATKLGTTAEHLWCVLVRQAPLSATINLLQLIGACAVAYILVRASIKLWEKEGNGEDCEGYAIVATVGAVAACFVAAVTLLYLPEAIVAGWFNPEYWALKQILK